MSEYMNDKPYYLNDVLNEMIKEHVDGKNFSGISNIDRKLKDLSIVTDIIKKKYKQKDGKYKIQKKDVPKVKAVFRVFLMDYSLAMGITELKRSRHSKYEKVMEIIDGVINDSCKVVTVKNKETNEEVIQEYMKKEFEIKIKEYHDTHKEKVTTENCLEHMKLVLEECIQAMLGEEHEELKRMGSVALKHGVEKIIADSEDELKFANVAIKLAKDNKEEFIQMKFEADLEGEIGYRIVGLLDKSLLESALDNDYNQVLVSYFKRAYDDKAMTSTNIEELIDKVEKHYYKLGEQCLLGPYLQQQLSDGIISIAKNMEQYISAMIVLQDYSEDSFRAYMSI